MYDWLQALCRLATADMSVGWFAGLAGTHAFVLTKFDERCKAKFGTTVDRMRSFALRPLWQKEGLAFQSKAVCS
ncbi:hypothetical protein [Mycolicibacterium sp. YH-1]|uniref:hypothetical protein n=1 Tax=Mycolicibacterium sp. YH-1 TaxID=2908837 RepID=UPI001F4C4E70|nr:hypothetical protein [Mycolicibacterium sp. YH-1]UNB54554.1 hypothetical protein L0M16_09650 [Mycolicibacterium sp. YH-1]